jgi:hypothetical protein
VLTLSISAGPKIVLHKIIPAGIQRHTTVPASNVQHRIVRAQNACRLLWDRVRECFWICEPPKRPRYKGPTKIVNRVAVAGAQQHAGAAGVRVVAIACRSRHGRSRGSCACVAASAAGRVAPAQGWMQTWIRGVCELVLCSTNSCLCEACVSARRWPTNTTQSPLRMKLTSQLGSVWMKAAMCCAGSGRAWSGCMGCASQDGWLG